MKYKIAAFALIISMACAIYYLLKANVKLEQENERTKCEFSKVKMYDKKKTKIIAMPNAKRDDIVNLMLQNQM